MIGLDLDRFAELSRNMTNAQLSRQYSIPILRIIDVKKELEEQGLDIGHAGLPASETTDYTEAIVHVKADSFIALGDAEIPDHDREMLEAAIDVGQRFGIRYMMLNGDIVAVDWLSDWLKTFAVPNTLDVELGAFEEVLGALCGAYEFVFEDEGNHERRLPHKVLGNISVSHLLKRRLPNLTWTRYSYLYITSCGPCGKGPEQTWLVTHQDNYAKVPLSVPLELCSINLCHVICGHNHRLAIGKHKSGRFWAIEGGHCRDINRTLYKVARKNRHPNWTAGFVMVLEGFPYLINKENYRQFLAGVVKQEDRWGTF